MYEKFLGVLTIWRIPGNLDKKRTRTYLWGRYPSQEQRYRTAAFSLIAALPHVWPCHVAEWWSGLLLYSLVTWSYSGGHGLGCEAALPRTLSEAVPCKSVSLCRYMGPVDSWHSGVRLWSMVDSLKVWYKWASWGVCPCWKAGGLMVFGQKSAESLGKPSRALHVRDSSLCGWPCEARRSSVRRRLIGVTLGVLKLVVQAGTSLSMSWSRVFVAILGRT
jgi:hypothetical protein